MEQSQELKDMVEAARLDYLKARGTVQNLEATLFQEGNGYASFAIAAVVGVATIVNIVSVWLKKDLP